MQREGEYMISLHRLNGSPIIVNLDLVEFVEPTPDTMVTFATGRKLVVKESIEEFIQLALEYKRKQQSFIQSLV